MNHTCDPCERRPTAAGGFGPDSEDLALLRDSTTRVLVTLTRDGRGLDVTPDLIAFQVYDEVDTLLFEKLYPPLPLSDAPNGQLEVVLSEADFAALDPGQRRLSYVVRRTTPSLQSFVHVTGSLLVTPAVGP